MYKQYQEEVLPILLESFYEALQCGFLLTNMIDAIIVVLLKKDKNPCVTDSYRPISLLNGNGKILTKVLAQHFQIIHSD